MLERNANYSKSQIYAHSIISLFPEKRKSAVVKTNIPPDFKVCQISIKFFPIWCNVISKAAGFEDQTHDCISGGRASDRATATFRCDSDSNLTCASTFNIDM